MNRVLKMLSALALAGFIGAALAEEGVRVILPDSMEYKPDPNLSGVSVAVLSGNPREGAYTVRVKLQPGAKLAAHFHPDMRTVTVMAGTYY